MTAPSEKGQIIASCGHAINDVDEGVAVYWKEETCDAADGFSPALAYGTFCPKCASEWREKGWSFETREDGERWLDETSGVSCP